MSQSGKKRTALVSRQKFAMMPASFIDQLSDQKEYAWVFLVLWDEASHENIAEVLVHELVARCKMSTQTILGALQWLQENGYIQRINVTDVQNKYLLSIEGLFAKTSKFAEIPVPDREVSKGLTGVGNLPAYCVGAGNTGSQGSPNEVGSQKSLRETEASQGCFTSLFPEHNGDGVGKEPEETPRQGNLLLKLPVPKAIETHKVKIVEFWKGKQGAKTMRAWKMQMTELVKLKVKYGDEALDEQLNAAILAGNWHGIRVINYERYGIDKNQKKNATINMNTHPSYKPLTYD